MSYVGSSAAVIPVGFSGVNSQSFNGDGSTVAFTLNRPVSAVNAIEVMVNNVQQSPYDGSYSVSSTTLTFSAAPSSGTANIYVVYRDFPVGSITDTSAVQKTGDTMTGDLIVDANVGVGTSSPTQKLTIEGAMNLRNGSRAGAFEIDSSGNLWVGTATTAGDIIFESGHSTTGLPSTGGERARILSSGGITFNGDTAAANALDDYEEGTFNCTIGYNESITSATSANATITVTARYIKIGRMVQVNFPYIERATTFGGTSVVVFYMTVPFTCGPSNGPGVLLAHYNLTARYATTVFSTWIPYAQVDVGTNQMRLGSGSYNQSGGGYITLEHQFSGMNFGCVYIASA